tara:strand:+ start:208 stop:480 length:273 start_codon:yes stop_codon:yes gene_type:complete
MLAIFEPKTLEIDKSGEPINADLMLIISSGAEVARETTVNPIKSLGILNFKEIETADFNKKFAPKTRTISPENNNKIEFISIFTICKYST